MELLVLLDVLRILDYTTDGKIQKSRSEILEKNMISGFTLKYEKKSSGKTGYNGA